MASILIADDSAGVAAGWRRMLEWDGHDVSVQPSGRGAVDELKRAKYDVVVADMATPQGGGLMVSGMARAFVRPENVIIVSDKLGDDDDIGAQTTKNFLREMGVEHILTKPVDANGLSLLVSRLTKQRKH